MKYGIALGGGGVRGAFQIGVWKAIRKMGVELCAAVGTSVGAVNGALIAQGDYETAVKMWQSVSANDILTLPAGMKGENDIFSASNLAPIAREIFTGGLDLTPLEQLLCRVIDEDKIRRSEIEFGAAAISLTNKNGVYKFVRDIPRGSLVSFITASASILGTKTVGGEMFSDGGLYDNLPVTMLAEHGIRDIIAVDVRGVGRVRGCDAKGRNIITIRSRSPQTGLMEFDRAGITRAIDEGYIEGLRALGGVSGERYAFYADDYQKARGKYSAELLSGLEQAAERLDVNKLEIYTIDGICAIVTDRCRKNADALKKLTHPKTPAASAIEYFVR